MPFRDPAESGHLRLFYKDRRPTAFGRFYMGVCAWASGLGLTPSIVTTLETSEPETGRLVRTVLAPVNHEGQRYLISMLGDGSRWVRNARAAGGDAFIKRGSRRRVKLAEIPAAERAPILKAWCRIAPSGRQHLPVPYDAPLPQFEAIAAHYPVFRIDPAP
jgi:hypothetical protein